MCMHMCILMCMCAQIGRVEALLAERLDRKMNRDFVRADQIRYELRDVHLVEVHDTKPQS